MIEDLQLAVATYGTLNEAKDNAILIPTWFSGTHQTWEQAYIGPWSSAGSRAVLPRGGQPDRQRVSPPRRTPPTTRRSPCRSSRNVRIGDDVRAQEILLRQEFGIERLALVVGGSMGAQQTWEWAVRLPGPGAAGRADRRHRPEHPARLPVHPDADGRDHLRSRGGTAAEYAAAADVAHGLRRHAGPLGRDGADQPTSGRPESLARHRPRRRGGWTTFAEFQQNFIPVLFG